MTERQIPMEGNIDPQPGKIDEPSVDRTEDEPKPEGELATKTKTMLGDAADWASDRLKHVSGRFTRSGAEHSDDVGQPGVAHRPPAPVSGDQGARAAGKVKDDIT